MAQEKALDVRQEMFRYAMNALARREHSVLEIRSRLRAKFDNHVASGLVEQVVARLEEEGILSDARFAEMLCSARFRRGYGPLRIRQELAEHRISEGLCEQLLSEYAGRWRAQVEALISKKFGHAPAPDYKTWARRARFLQARGFGADLIHVALAKDY